MICLICQNFRLVLWKKNDTVYNLTESIESVLERYNKLKEQDGYCIHFEYDGKVQVKADEYKIYQVIYNLINNAINYTGKDKNGVGTSEKFQGIRCGSK